VDTNNVLVQYLKVRNLLNVAVSSRNGYDHGMAQPAMLVLKKDGTVLFNWAIVPGLVGFLTSSIVSTKD